jgi:hypothetical protein
VILTDLFRRLALRGWWPQATGAAILLLGVTYAVSRLRPVPSRPESARALTLPRRSLPPWSGPIPHEATGAKLQNPGFEHYTDIYRVDRPTDDHCFVFSFSPELDTAGIIGCVDAFGGEWRWRRHAVADGRYTCIDVGQTTLLEITGWPQANTLAVRRLSDGAVLGRPWEVGRIWLTAISGRRVATVGEGPATQRWEQDDSLYERPAVTIYDEWGHLLRSFRVKGVEQVTGFRHGFALGCRDRTLILTHTGRVVRILK